MLSFIEVGYVQKAHGIKGEALVSLYEGESSYLSKGLSLKIGQQDLTLESFRKHKASFILTFSEIKDRNEAEKLKSKKISINSDLLDQSKTQDEYFLRDILGFRVLLKERVMGEIIGFSSTPAHDLITVELKESSLESGAQVEIPWVKEYITELLFESSTVVLDCPEEIFDPQFFKG